MNPLDALFATEIVEVIGEEPFTLVPAIGLRPAVVRSVVSMGFGTENLMSHFPPTARIVLPKGALKVGDKVRVTVELVSQAQVQK